MKKYVFTKRLDYFFDPLYFGRFYLAGFKPKWRFVNDYIGIYLVKGYLDPLNVDEC
jgi:hypothetical protein